MGWFCYYYYYVASVVSDSVRPHGLQPTRLLRPWDSPGKNTGVGCHALLQGIFLTQGLNPGILNCRQILYHLSHQGITTTTIIALIKKWLTFTSVQFSHSVVSDSLRPHGPQHARPACPSASPALYSDSRPSSGWFPKCYARAVVVVVFLHLCIYLECTQYFL